MVLRVLVRIDLARIPRRGSQIWHSEREKLTLSQDGALSQDEVVLKLALLLGLGMLFGPALPLLVPLLCVGVLSEGLLAGVAWDANILHGITSPGDIRFAVIMTTVVSGPLSQHCKGSLVALKCCDS